MIDESVDYIGDLGWSIEYKDEKTNRMTMYHNHEMYELYYLIEGKRILFVDNKEIVMSKGSMVVIAPGTHHKFMELDKGEKYSCIVIYFKKSLFPQRFLKKKQYSEILGNRYFEVSISDEMTELVEKIKHDIISKSHMTDIMLHGKIFQIIAIALNNRTNNNISSKTALENEDVLTLVRIYIDKNLDKELSLEALSSRFFISQPYLSKSFKKNYSINISDYITERRIQKAIWLMNINSKCDVEKFARECGFTSKSNFYRTFKNITGQSPKAFFANAENEQFDEKAGKEEKDE